VFAGAVGGVGLWVLLHYVNALTMWLTLATFVGYAVVYTVILKPLTPQNIVIGGASGAMPPVLGWAAVTGEVTTEAMLLFLIIFAWTPPHFWALALYRTEDYARAGVPMLPVTHGQGYTRLQVLLYTLILFGVSLLPYAVRMSGWLYLTAAVALGLVYIGYAVRIYRSYSDQLARSCFRYSIVYLSALFAALLVDGGGALSPSQASCWQWRRSSSLPAARKRRSSAAPISAARISAGNSRSPGTTASPVRSPISAASWWYCSSAIRTAPTSARPRLRTWRR
jgi:heme O synthase-like polyprenyltransferase